MNPVTVSTSDREREDAHVTILCFSNSSPYINCDATATATVIQNDTMNTSISADLKKP